MGVFLSEQHCAQVITADVPPCIAEALLEEEREEIEEIFDDLARARYIVLGLQDRLARGQVRGGHLETADE